MTESKLTPTSASGKLVALIAKLSIMSLFILATAAAAIPPHQKPTPLGETVWRTEPATPERMNQRIAEAAVKYQDHAPIARAVFYDIGYPANKQEFANLDGCAVILISALSQEQDELPLKRVYVLADAQQIELKSVQKVLVDQSGTSSPSTKTFGNYRADALYLLPVYLRLKATEVLVDFAKNKNDYKIATFGTEVDASVSNLPRNVPTGSGPSENILKDFIKREFPGFFKE